MADLRLPAIKQMMSRLNVQSNATTNRAKIKRVKEGGVNQTINGLSDAELHLWLPVAVN